MVTTFETEINIMENDWRLNGQEDYLINVSLKYTRYVSSKTNEHEHCIFCWHKFMEDCIDVIDCSIFGYLTLDNKYWICDKCFEDFKELFKWDIVK